MLTKNPKVLIELLFEQAKDASKEGIEWAKMYPNYKNYYVSNEKTRRELGKIILPFVEGTNAENKGGDIYACVPTRHENKIYFS